MTTPQYGLKVGLFDRFVISCNLSDTLFLDVTAIAYLAAVLGELGPKSLSRQQVPVIAQFLCDRLEDETGLKEVTSGLTSLARMQHFGNDEALQVTSALMGIDLPKHPPTTRFTALTLVDSLVSAYRDVLKSMGGRFITGIAEMVGGEKDPRNLMIVFSVMKVILVEFDIVRHTEVVPSLDTIVENEGNQSG
jgi:DNA repair/transcription protein MET18/MMS19